MKKNAAGTAKLAVYAALILITAVMLFPLIYTISNSFIGSDEFSKYYGGLSKGVSELSPLHIIPDYITLNGYAEVFIRRPDFLLKFWISLLLSTSIVAGQLIVSVLGGYAFSRFRFPGRDLFFLIVILIMMMPYQVTLVPNYIVLEKMGLIRSYSAVILPGVFSAFGVFLLRQVMAGLPESVMQAAKIDGAGSMTILLKIVVPNCKAGITSLLILSFADNWNMIEQPIVFLQDNFKMPLSVILTRINGMRPDISFTCGFLSIIPVLLLYLHYKDEMIEGIEYSVLK